MSVASRVPTIVLLGLVLVAAALLIAGYGAAVGIGVIAGLVLGIAVILAILAMNPQTRGGASVAWLAPASSPDPRDRDEIQRYHLDWMRVAGVDASALRRVIAAGTSVDAGGARLELVAVEVREDGCVASAVVHTRPPIGQVGHFVAVSVTDDAGTEYAAAGQGSGGGNVGISRFDLRFAPAPPPGARVLTIRIDSFVAPYPTPAERLDGPWEFRINL